MIQCSISLRVGKAAKAGQMSNGVGNAQQLDGTEPCQRSPARLLPLRPWHDRRPQVLARPTHLNRCCLKRLAAMLASCLRRWLGFTKCTRL